MLTVGHFTQSRAAFAKDFAHFAGTQTNGDVGTFASNQLDSSASTASYLSTFTRLQFDRVDSATYRDVAQRQRVTGLDRRIGTRDQLIASSNAFRGDDVATLTVGILQQSNMSSTIRIVLDALYNSGDAVLVTTEVHDAVVLLMSAPTMTRGDAAIVVTTTRLALLLQQRCVRSTFVQVSVNDLDDEAAASGSRFTFNNCHDVPLSYSALAKSMS